MKRSQFVLGTIAAFALADCSKVVNAPGDSLAAGDIKVERTNVRNFDQMNETMSLLTGVPVSSVASTYNRDTSGGGLRGALPGSNSLKEFNGSQQGAIVRLATQYCGEYANSLAANSYALFKSKYPFFGASFSNNIATDFTDAQLKQLVESFYNNLWGSCMNRPALDAVQTEIGELVSDMKVELKDDAINNKPLNYFRIVCSVFLSSSCVSVF